MTDRIIVGANGRKYITTEPTRKQNLQVALTDLPEPVGVVNGVGHLWAIEGNTFANGDKFYTATQMIEYRNAALEEALSCYSPDDTATDWADKIEALKEKQV